MEERDLVRKAKEGEKEKVKSGQKRSSHRKPWGLVVGIVLVLAGLGVYINWLNSPDQSWTGDLSSTLFDNTETESLPDSPADKMDSLDLWERSLLPQEPVKEDSTEDGWKGEVESNPLPPPTRESAPAVASKPLPESPRSTPSARAENTPATPTTARPAPSPRAQVPSRTMYSVIAGEFANRSDAQARVKELRQGNYPAKLMEPEGNNAIYRVRIGRFENSAQAKKQAAEIAFILDIKTTVAEMIE